MASTYSPSLKLELIGNGDQSGTWGTTTNTNLGTLLEQAITGVQAITMTNADYTLSNLNGAADEARNAVLVVGGTNAAIRNVIAPAVEKLYVIRNNTVGGFAIVIKTSASTGVSIANGTTAYVYCDGSEFYLAVPPYASTNTASTLVFRDGSGNFAAGTITANLNGNASTVTTNANLTGAVTSVGNATSLGSFTSANLAAALTDETGTGANVFANTPTLVTPVLGTPTSGTLTNCTGYTYANLAGTVPTWNQNTSGNAATATVLQTARNIGGVSFNGSADINLPGVNTAGNQNTSGNAATATTATSATTATNQSGGTVAATTGSFSGVATFSAGSAGAPAITTSGDTNTGMFFPAADTIAFGEGGTEAMRIDSSGNVGIGTTSPGYRLHVNGGDARVSNTADAVLSLAGGSANLNITSTNSDYATFVSGGNSLGVGITYGSGVCAFENSTGRVGIGTTSPSSTLQVVGTVPATTFVGNLSGNATTASNAIGTGQTWQDLSGSRSSGTTYTNSTGRSIFISVKWDRDDGTLSITVDGLEIGKTGTTAGPQFYTLTAIVPAGSTYSATASGGGGTLSWYELR